MEVRMSKPFAVRRLDSLMAPSFCGAAYEIANQGTLVSVFFAEYTVGVFGYYQLYCYLAG